MMMGTAKDVSGRAKKLSPTKRSTRARSKARSQPQVSAGNVSVHGQTSGDGWRGNLFDTPPGSIHNLKALGSDTKTVYNYDGADAKLLERFENPSFVYHSKQRITITAPEFTSLCPKTGQPDFATIIINYMPQGWCVESKALKLYLGSYRQYPAFHEAIVRTICEDLAALLVPHYIRVTGQFSARGGITFHPVSDWWFPKD